MVELLQAIWTSGGFFTKGNSAREYANRIAEAACRGWITTETLPEVFGNKWFITEIGLTLLNKAQGKGRVTEWRHRE